jgi:hypothetical protein
VTPEYIASKLSLLPQFEVTAIHRGGGKQGVSARLEGTFSKPMPVEEQGANLFLQDLRFMDGLLLAYCKDSWARSIEVYENAWIEILESEILDSSLAFFGNYDRRRLNLVINPAIVWIKEEFAPRPALQQNVIGTDGKSYRQLREYQAGMEIPSGASVIEVAWDHEHCIFCLNRINQENIGYSSHHDGEGDGEWACDWCYKHAIQNHDPRPLLIPYVERH